MTDWVRAFLTTIALAALIAPAGGCGSDGVQQPTYPASGQVLFDGKPVAGAVVVFHPVDPAKFKWGERPQGRTDAEGRFTLYTYKTGDGAPEGDYKVAIALVAALDEEGGDQVKRAKGPPLPAKYGDHDKSGLSAKLSAGPTALEPFQLTAK